MNELVKFEDERGQQVSISAQDIKQLICPQATDKETALFLELCKRQRLNPFVKDAYLVKYGSAPASMITSKDVFVKRANANPAYEGIEHGIVYLDKKGTVQRREGSAVYKVAGEQLIGGWARVYIKGKKPVYAELALDEYSTGKSNWAKMPSVMISKCSQVCALRLAFASDMQGLYAAEEMGAQGERVQVMQEAPVIEQVVEVQAVEKEKPRAASTEQLGEVNACMITLSEARGVEYKKVYDALIATNAMQQLEAEAGVEFNNDQADAALQILAKWIDQAQEKQAQAEIVEAYEQEQLAEEDIVF